MTNESALKSPIKPSDRWRALRRSLNVFLSDHHGVISRAELLELGYSASGVDRLLRDRTLVRLCHGVYRGGAAPPGVDGELRRDLLRGGPRSVLTRRSAGHLLGYLQFRPEVTQIVVPGRSGFRKSISLERHADADLDDDEVIEIRGHRCSSPYLTVLSLAAESEGDSGSRVLRRALRAAAAENPTLVHRLRAAVDQRVAGASLLRGELKGGLERTLVIRSGVEDRFVELCKAYGLPIPETNVVVHGIELDNWFRDHDAYVEVDTYGTHGDEVSFERDRENAAKLAALGIHGLRVTDRRMDHEPAAVAADTRGLLRLG